MISKRRNKAYFFTFFLVVHFVLHSHCFDLKKCHCNQCLHCHLHRMASRAVGIRFGCLDFKGSRFTFVQSQLHFPPHSALNSGFTTKKPTLCHFPLLVTVLTFIWHLHYNQFYAIFYSFFLSSWIMWLPLCVPVEAIHPSVFLSKLRSHCAANTSYHRTWACVHPGLSNTGLRQRACSPCTCVGGTLTGRTCTNAHFLLSAYACTYWTIFVKSTETEKK